MPGNSTILKLQELSAGSFRLTSGDKTNAWPAHGKVETESGLIDVDIYIRSIGQSGRDRPTERRFQNPASANSRPITEPDNGYALLLGLWTEQGDDQAVVVAMDAYRRLHRETRFSLFMPLRLLEAAARKGPEQFENSAGEVIHAFRPSQMGSYVDRLVREQSDAKTAPFPSDSSWENYRLWNAAIANDFFSGRSQDKLIYLDLDDASVKRLGESLGLKETDCRAALTESVRTTLDLNRNDGSIFNPHLKVLARWRRDQQNRPPPCLSLLALFASVAEGMRADENFASTNYYGRLATALGIDADGDVSVLGRDFRADSTLFWDALNSWLEESDGIYGLPTAFAFDRRRFVSIPISQALVREKDRLRLLQCFDNFGLRPGQRVAAADMERVLEDWLPDSSVSSALKTLWRSRETRRKIAEIAALELEAWDGVREELSTSDDVTKSLLVAISCQSQPRASFRFAFVARESPSLPPGDYCFSSTASPNISSPDRQNISLTEALFRGYLRMAGDTRLNFSQALMTDIDLVPKSKNGCSVSRRWKPLIVLRFDRETNLFIETKRVELAERHIIMCHDSIADRVERHLEKIAAGFSRLDNASNSTVPRNWSLFTNVRVAGICPIDSDDLQSLVAVASTNIVLDGGLALPTRNTWHARHPPAINIATLNEGECSAELLCVQDLSGNGESQSSRVLGNFSHSGAFDLSALGMPPGDYRVLAKEADGRSRSVIASAAVRLRNAEHQRTIPVSRLGHNPEAQSPVWTLTACNLEDGDTKPTIISTKAINWPDRKSSAPDSVQIPVNIGSRTGEIEGLPDAERNEAPDIVVTPPACIDRGHHIWGLPPEEVSHPKHQTLLGGCKDCGLEKWFGGRPVRRRGRPRHSRHHAEFESRVIEIEFSSPKSDVSADTLFDALCHIKTANRRTVANLIETFSDRPWLTDEVLRYLSSLGHIEVQLDHLVSQITAWSISETTLNYVSEDLIFLSGYRTPSLLRRLREDSSALGGKFEVRRQQMVPSRVSVSGVDRLDVGELASSIADGIGLPIDTSIEPSHVMASRLPNFSDVIEALPRTSLLDLPCQHFDLERLKWIDVDKPERSGAYRFKSWTWSYAILDDESLRNGEQRCGDYRVVKHAAATFAETPLIAYDEHRRILSVPLGAELPWLYERAIVLESGLEPVRRQNGCVEYTGVSKQIARLLWSSMAG